MYWGKSGCIQTIVVVIGQKFFYSGKVVLCGGKRVVFGKSSCILASWLYTGKAVLFGQSGCIRAKLVVLG